MIVKCCVCGAIIDAQCSQTAETAVTHSYCDHCLEELMERSHREDAAAEFYIDRR